MPRNIHSSSYLNPYVRAAAKSNWKNLASSHLGLLAAEEARFVKSFLDWSGCPDPWDKPVTGTAVVTSISGTGENTVTITDPAGATLT